ncbi:MAG TPA: hypothetical protein VEI58_10950 [Chthoniobacterales bacterium]|nr:hypothetical protein [Chthoniobacterales bacterium]
MNERVVLAAKLNFRIRFAIAGSMIAVAVGCSGLDSKSSSQAVSSKPPASAILLTAPVTVNQQGKATTFPAGEYRFIDQDRSGYYFKAPQKVIVDDIAVFAYQGGLCVSRGKTEPDRWYVLANGGRQTGRFKKIPPHKLIP